MNYIERLKSSFQKFNSLVCLGLDPVLEEIPLQEKPKEKIIIFYEEILNKIIQTKIYPSVVKPNYAFYAQYGFEGLEALFKVISLYKEQGFPVILDVKRGDIGKTAQAYACEAFDFFQADAVTLSPFLGYDSIAPFVEQFPDKGFYLLTKTSNKSSGEIQDIVYQDQPFFMYIAQKIIEWFSPGLGSVVGATFPEQLKKISEKFIGSNQEIPLLIPGIGTQGGSLAETINVLKEFKDYKIHRLNSSSGINYAYKKHSNLKFDAAAVKALKELNNQIEEFL